MLFSWSTAVDVDGDTISYLLNIKVSGIDTIFATTDTTLTVDFGALGLADQTYGVSWSVTATDGQVTTAAENGTGTLDVITGVKDEELAAIPSDFALYQNYPNPFNPSTEIKYEIPFVSQVNLTLFNSKGQRIGELIDEELSAGFHSITWDGLDGQGNRVGSGVYFYRLEARSPGSKPFTSTMKMLLLK